MPLVPGAHLTCLLSVCRSFDFLQDVSHAVFLKLLEYLYTDTLSDVTANQAVHLLVASEQ